MKKQQKTVKVTKYVDKSEQAVTRERKSVIVERAFELLHQEHGQITPQLVLDEAQSPTSPLHMYFEWDDTEAARKYRLIQAMNMLMASKFVVELAGNGDVPAAIAEAKPAEVRKWLPQFGGGDGGGFKMRNEVLATDDGRAAFIERKLGVLRAWCAAVVDVPELQPVRETLLDMVRSFTNAA